MSELVLSAPQGANKKKRIVGRGSSSGRGTTAGRGNKGQQSRSGGKTYVGFEGGQMPLYCRIARRGFSNYPYRKEYAVVNLELIAAKFAEGDTVNRESLIEKGLLKKIIRLLALILPLLKSETLAPVAPTVAVIASADSLIFTTRLTSGWIKASALWASASSACTPYGKRTAIN